MKTSELLAAKSSFEDNTKWLPFNVHANDTAGIIKRLFNKWIAQNVRRRLCAAIGIESSENAEEIVCNYCKFIALVHDIGKLTPAFQRKLKDNIQGLADRLLDAGIDLSGLTQISESPHNINRDDTGRPKTAFYGGANRARVSSQSWKHAMRLMFNELFTSEELGYRTMHAVDLIANEIKKLDSSFDDETAVKEAIKAMNSAGVKINEKKDNKTGALFFISAVQANNLAQLVISGEKDAKLYKQALKETPSVDIALFGRMVADDADLNVDAASQVAHSISTHAVQNEYDYFTAVDDCSPEDSAGAGHLGTTEFNSSTLYRYATVNVAQLKKSIGVSVAEVIKGFAEAFICSMPTGKQNSYANRTYPDMVYVTIRKDQPVNLVGAFEKPVISNNGYVEESVKKLQEYAGKVYDNFSGKPVKSFMIGADAISDAERVNLDELLEKLYSYIKDEVV